MRLDGPLGYRTHATGFPANSKGNAVSSLSSIVCWNSPAALLQLGDHLTINVRRLAVAIGDLGAAKPSFNARKLTLEIPGAVCAMNQFTYYSEGSEKPVERFYSGFGRKMPTHQIQNRTSIEEADLQVSRRFVRRRR